MRFTDTSVSESIRSASKIPCETLDQKGFANPSDIVFAASPDSVRTKVQAVGAKREVTFSGITKTGSLSEGAYILSWDAGAGYFTSEQLAAYLVNNTGELGSSVITPGRNSNSVVITAAEYGEAGNLLEVSIESTFEISPALVITGDFDESGGSSVTFNLAGGVNTILPGSEEFVQSAKDQPARYISALSKITTVSATSITLQDFDNGKIIELTSASPVTIYLPSIDPGDDFSIAFLRSGAGTVTFNANGKTLNSQGGFLSIGAQHAWASLIRTGANTYNLSGTIA